jgi:hypothetical protein
MRIASIATATLIFSAAPAAAQISMGPQFTSGHAIGAPTHVLRHHLSSSAAGITADLDLVRESIRDGIRSGELTPDEAKALRREAAEIDKLQGRMLNGGLSRPERTVLSQQVAGLNDRVSAQRSN